MIKVDRNKNYSEVDTAKDILKREREKLSGNYNQPEVLDALKLIFNSKCYICENKKITSYNIEHLRPHKELNIDLKFNWNNLFLVCGHCNNIKSARYENILDCTEVDVDECISFRKEGNFSWNEYWDAEGEDKEDAKYLIIRELKSSSPFAAFKRWIVRDNRENLIEFLEKDSNKIKNI